MELLEKHWGDIIGLLLIYTGLAVMFAAAGFGIDGSIADAGGKGLVGAGLLALKLRSGTRNGG